MKKHLFATLLGVSAALSTLASSAVACGLETDCQVGDRTYRLYLPEADGPTGVLFFAHGYRGSAAGAMRNESLMRLADDFGMAFVALDAGADDWNLAHRPQQPDQTETQEYGYVADVLADLATRMEVDSDRLVLTGFSAGGMFVWNIACGMADAFQGFVPYSGTFWLAPPETCPTGPSNVVHIHGTEDSTVPLSGRPIGQTRQGDVPDTLAMYRRVGGFEPVQTVPAAGAMSCEQSANTAGQVLDFCTFSGGHSFSIDRVRHGVERVLNAG
ncbi:MAG: dienelactone hydrolase family protein [Pseudomonadota bacterium]